MSTANALQLEAGRRRTVPIRFYTSPVASLKSLSLSAAILERIYCLSLRYAVTLNFDPVTLTFDLCSLNFDLMTLNLYHVLRYALG